MALLPAIPGPVRSVVAGGAGLAAATFLVYRAYALVALGRGVDDAVGRFGDAVGRFGDSFGRLGDSFGRLGGVPDRFADVLGRSGDGRTADGSRSGSGAAADAAGATRHLRRARYTVVLVGTVAGTGLFVASVDAYLRTATALVGALGVRPGRTTVVIAVMTLWGATVVATVLAGVRGYAPLSADRGRVRSRPEAGRTVAAAAAYAGTLCALLALLAVEPLAAALAVAVGRPAAAAAGPAIVAAVERTRPLPEPWDDRTAALSDRLGVAVRGGRAVADDREVRVSVAGLLPDRRVLFVTDRALEALDGDGLAVLVVRELARARRHAAARTVLVETLPVVLWLASFRLLAVGQAILVGVLLVGPYAVAVGLVGHRDAFAADDAAADLLGVETVAAAIERAADADGAPVDRDPAFDLLAGRPAPRRRVERLREAGGGRLADGGDDGALGDVGALADAGGGPAGSDGTTASGGPNGGDGTTPDGRGGSDGPADDPPDERTDGPAGDGGPAPTGDSGGPADESGS